MNNSKWDIVAVKANSSYNYFKYGQGNMDCTNSYMIDYTYRTHAEKFNLEILGE